MFIKSPGEVIGKVGAFMLPFGKPVAFASGLGTVYGGGGYYLLATLVIPPGVMKDYVYVIVGGTQHSSGHYGGFSMTASLRLQSDIPGDNIVSEPNVVNFDEYWGSNYVFTILPFSAVLIYTPSANALASKYQINLGVYVAGSGASEFVYIRAMAFVG